MADSDERFTPYAMSLIQANGGPRISNTELAHYLFSRFASPQPSGTRMLRTMPSSRKINLEKVRASLDVVCPKCGRAIPPAEVRRVDFERIECPACGKKFVPCHGLSPAPP
jgi:hypothetical protein